MSTLSRRARRWRQIRRLGKALEGATKTVGPVVAALWIAWQYHIARVDKRVEATLTYVTRYEASDTSTGKAQRALTASLWDHADEISELRTTRASKEGLANVRATIAERVISSASSSFGGPSSLSPLDELDDFYNALATCVQGNVCDTDAAVRFFGCAAIDLVDNFGSAMQTRERLATRFGWGVRWIAAQARVTGSCPA